LCSRVTDAPDVDSAEVSKLNTREGLESALILTALTQRSPKLRTKLPDQAENQNFQPWPYQPMIRHVIAECRRRKD